MAFKWKPSVAAKQEYKTMLEQKALFADKFIKSNRAIRTGCKVEFFSENLRCVVSGEVLSHSYGSEKGQHTFTISTSLMTSGRLLVKGRNLYPNLIKHEPGAESLIV
jgi:hypothetical protein